MPVGAYGGRQEIMDAVSPAGPVYQAGTLAGNPVAMAAGFALVSYLKEHPDVYQQLNATGETLANGIRQQLKEAGVAGSVNQVGSMFTLFFTATRVVDFETAKTSDTARFGKYFQAMLQEGIYLAPSQYEALFVSTALDTALINRILDASAKALRSL
jgi:glutamate-1-semialdehyde 2,1-aminomutase